MKHDINIRFLVFILLLATFGPGAAGLFNHGFQVDVIGSYRQDPATWIVVATNPNAGSVYYRATATCVSTS